ncbi:MAG TPA: aspartate--tRNA(Asn) ligase [Candidatus Bathyarchaeia archaeon]|nr:aspartate--tRNA(Asn) ligase [Candidatus Bathyarchaeia archaeon]
MPRTLAKQTLKKVGQNVKLMGWVNTRRDHGKLVFIDLRDRSGMVQVVCDQKAGDLKLQDIVSIEGIVKKRPANMVNDQLPTGTVEVKAKEIKTLVKAAVLPFDMAGPELKVELPTLLDYRSLTLRHPKVSAIFKVQEVVLQTFRKTLKQHGFTEISVPTLVATATEGGSDVFPVQYFDHQAYLSQSPQFYKQIMVGVFERVFTTAHAYRAEPSVTTRHMTEYVGLDAEMGFINDWSEIIKMAETVVKEIFGQVKKHCQEQLKLFKTSIPKTIEKTPQVKLKEALEIVYKRTKKDHRQEPDLDPEDEREICRWAKEEKGSDLVFITHYPTKKRPMYTYPDPENPNYTLSFDLLGRGVEWITGGQRINDYQRLQKNIKKWGCQIKDFEIPYLQAFKYGIPQEGGFCLGLERITQNILGLPNIRQATLFPRDMTRIDIRLAEKTGGKPDKNPSEKT